MIDKKLGEIPKIAQTRGILIQGKGDFVARTDEILTPCSNALPAGAFGTVVGQ
jgi:hypothetical protein